MNKEKDFYTVYEMANRMNVSHTTIYRWIEEGLKFIKKADGRRVRKVISDEDMNEFLMNNPELQ